MLRVFIDGENLQDQIRQGTVKEGQVFYLKLSNVSHESLGQWEIYFENILQRDSWKEVKPLGLIKDTRTAADIRGDERGSPECTAETPCCDRRGEYNGFASGSLKFECPKHCPCHD
jgi:hypothetical protein